MKIKEGGVMDIQKEREAFEAAMFELAGGQTKNEINPVNGRYMYGVMEVMWKVWQAAKAQAVPEGFVLVPLDVVERCMSHICLAMFHQNNSNSENDVVQMDLEILESALEAQGPSNEN